MVRIKQADLYILEIIVLYWWLFSTWGNFHVGAMPYFHEGEDSRKLRCLDSGTVMTVSFEHLQTTHSGNTRGIKGCCL